MSVIDDLRHWLFPRSERIEHKEEQLDRASEKLDEVSKENDEAMRRFRRQLARDPVQRLVQELQGRRE